VSCTSTTACTAVGYFFNSANHLVTMAEHWNGTNWTIQPTPNPAGATGSQLYSVSCTSITACTAVGYFMNSVGTHLTLAERWNGTSWSLQTTPNPTGAMSSDLLGIRCTSTTACSAVGNYYNRSGTQLTLAERWNGTTWAVRTTPNPTGASSSALLDVSCTSATACTAVGNYNNRSGTRLTLAERWNGTGWAIQPTANLAGADFTQLSGVSCTSSMACTAVGDGGSNSGTAVTLAERWNGANWAIQPTPNPAGSTQSSLGAVSCTLTTACTAVGAHTPATTELPLVEQHT
jgi:hypothetical protein